MQQTTMRDVEDVLAKYHNDSRVTKEPVLMSEILEMERLKNKGFPKWMHHAGLPSVEVTNKDQERGLMEKGYQVSYIHKEYPKFIFRRNTESTVIPACMIANVLIPERVAFKFAAPDHIEERQIKNPAEEAKYRDMEVEQGCTGWFDLVADIPKKKRANEEDPAVTIARLQGQLAGAGKK